MVKPDARSRQASLAVREAEGIVKRKAWRQEKPDKPPESGRTRRRLIHGLLIGLFFVFCFMPALVILALAILGIALTR